MHTAQSIKALPQLVPATRGSSSGEEDASSGMAPDGGVQSARMRAKKRWLACSLRTSEAVF
jgi:hypothetical protein